MQLGGSSRIASPDNTFQTFSASLFQAAAVMNPCAEPCMRAQEMNGVQLGGSSLRVTWGKSVRPPGAGGGGGGGRGGDYPPPSSSYPPYGSAPPPHHGAYPPPYDPYGGYGGGYDAYYGGGYGMDPYGVSAGPVGEVVTDVMRCCNRRRAVGQLTLGAVYYVVIDAGRYGGWRWAL